MCFVVLIFASQSKCLFCETTCRICPCPQKPWKSINFSFQNLSPQKSLNFTKNSWGPWKVLKFSSPLCRFWFVYCWIAIIHLKINYTAWSVLFFWLPWSVIIMYKGKGLVQQPKLSNLPSSTSSLHLENHVSWLGHMKAARVNISSFMHFIEQMVFSLIIGKIIIRQIHAIRTLKKSHDLKQYVLEV